MKEAIEYFNGDELAASVWSSKYKQKGDETPKDLHARMSVELDRADEIHRLKEYNSGRLSEYGQKRDDMSVDKYYELLDNFKYIVPQGSIMSGLGVNDQLVSLSNCFILPPPSDSYGGILERDEEQIHLMKRRGGVGFSLSSLRPNNAKVSNAAKTSTGLVSFMHRYSNSTREVAQDGRRGALMLSADIRHPDIEEFIKVKSNTSKVTGANISVMVNDEFMKAVESGDDYILKFPVTTNVKSYLEVENKELPYGKLIELTKGVFAKRVVASEIWEQLVEAAHKHAEPGIMFWDRFENGSPDSGYKEFKPVGVNPCAEIGTGPYDSCRLSAINLYSFVKNPFKGGLVNHIDQKEAEFDYEKFYEVAYEQLRLLDNVVDLEGEKIGKIISKLNDDPEPLETRMREINLWQKILKSGKEGRRAGGGITAVGDMFAAMGMKYGGDASLYTMRKIMETKMRAELDCSIDMAIMRGKFPSHSNSRESGSYYVKMSQMFPTQYTRMQLYGRRNISFSTVAPTGSVSILTRTTSGIEPLFAPYYMRRKKVNPNEDTRVDFTDEQGDQWTEYPILHPKFKDWMEGTLGTHDMTKESLDEAFEKSPWFGSTANDISWEKRVELQSIIQDYTSHSISSTINLPKSATVEDVDTIYTKAWKDGLKGLTVYRDGSRDGVLVTETSNKGVKLNTAAKRPATVDMDLYHSTAMGVEYTVVVGLLEGSPYEIFISNNKFGKHGTSGHIIKNGGGKYKVKVGDEIVCENLIEGMNEEEEAIARLVSTSLRHGVEPRFLVDQLQKTPGSLFGFTKSVARILKKYIKDGSKSTIECDECKSKNVVFEDGCHVCKDCGSTRCS